MNSYPSALASLPSISTFTSSAFSAHSDSSAASYAPPNSLSTPFDKPSIAKDTALIIIGCEHTNYFKQEHKITICTRDAIVPSLNTEAPIYNIEILRAAQRLGKHHRHVRIVLNDSSQAAQLLYHRLYDLTH